MLLVSNFAIMVVCGIAAGALYPGDRFVPFLFGFLAGWKVVQITDPWVLIFRPDFKALDKT